MATVTERFEKTKDGKVPRQESSPGRPLAFPEVKVESLNGTTVFSAGNTDTGLTGNVILLPRNDAGATFTFNIPMSGVSFAYWIRGSTEGKGIEAIFLDDSGAELGRVSQEPKPGNHSGTIQSPLSAKRIKSVTLISPAYENAVNAFTMTV